ncbi:hypothetical protein ACQUQP_19740 [Marinobacterium sp. YM272]|uniref:hypothetical protein n=1 Tax=Marinobacterium sp. YM272 TaxID=3421654 RepID=UPI003D7F724A
MLKLFKDARTAKLVNALRSGDRETLNRLAKKFTPEQLTQPLTDNLNALEIALQAGQPAALLWVIEQLPEHSQRDRDQVPYLLRSLQHESESLALITALLQAGFDASISHDERSLLEWCFEHCEPQTLMLHLSRLTQHGATLENTEVLVIRALEREDQACVNYLISSGAPLPAELDQVQCSDALRSYARRCADDKKIREMMLGR